MKLSIKKFMWFDIIILSIIAILVDTVTYIMLRRPAEPGELPITLYLAPGITVIFLTYIRWGKYAIVTNLAVLGINLIFYLEQIKENPIYIFIVILGYLSWLLTLYFRKIFKTGKYSTWYVVPFVFVLIYIMQILVEGLGLTIFKDVMSFEANSLKHLINLVISFIVVVIISLQNKLAIDMKYHLENKEDEV